MEKYLPIGSVCTLKGKNKKVMITGFYSIEFNGNLKINDYCGCTYPEGFLLPELNCTFNHDDIETIDFVGYENSDQKKFNKLLKNLNSDNEFDKESYELNEKDDWILQSSESYSKLLFDENGVVVLAEPVVEKKIDNSYKFDENGIVVKDMKNLNNPFYKEYNYTETDTIVNSDNNIFNSNGFDKSDNVVSELEKQKGFLNKIEFDENGVVISANMEPSQDNSYANYRFDENGVLISIGEEEKEEEIPPIGPGLPGYVEPKKESNYRFDENGVLISVNEEEKEEEIPPIGPGLPGYVEPKKESNYRFDENGVLISVDEEEKEEEIPPIGPGLPGYEELKKDSSTEFDENDTLVDE